MEYFIFCAVKHYLFENHAVVAIIQSNLQINIRTYKI